MTTNGLEITILKADVLKSGLRALYYSGAHHILAPFSQGIGLIFMLHQVSRERPSPFAANRGLMVTPEFLDSVLHEVKRARIDIVSLDEAYERIRARGSANRFACFTLDDGYRDNLQQAYPVFTRHRAPFAIYVPSDFPEGRGDLWWFAIEKAILSSDEIALEAPGGVECIPTKSDAEKQNAFNRIYRHLRNMDEAGARRIAARICDTAKVDTTGLCRELIMSWDEIRDLNTDPLVTIGAHTQAHFALARLPEKRAREEMRRGADLLEKQLGVRPLHLSYPYGDPGSAGPREFRIAEELGFKTAVTTRKGVIFPEHAEHLTALPRVSLNGEYQSTAFTRLFMSGAPFALWNGFRKVDAA
ncbi:MAG: polysaccharide deacetylase family protein [Hyphomicrobiaceae bacterium]|nr:polysaccharide deacetylase family protein [Hyphomicrobiaceae bacterium]